MKKTACELISRSVSKLDVYGRITTQLRAEKAKENTSGGEYGYYEGKNRLKSVADSMGGTADTRIMSVDSIFVYDSEGNLVEDKSKRLKIFYDWRGMPIEFIQESQPTGSSNNTLFRLTMSYDGSGRRISKTRWVKNAGSQDWEKELVTHYTGIGTEIREDFSKNQTKVVVNMPEGFGRYGVEDASGPDMGFGAGYIPNTKFEWYLKNHLGSTMLVYGTEGNATSDPFRVSAPLAAYDYRAFGEMVELTPPPTGKVTENFTGKEHDDEIALDYFGARYLDPMLGMWTSVDPARQFASPYLYAGNGYNPVNGVDPDGNYKLELNEDNSIKSMSENDDLNRVSVFNADGSLLNTFAAPPSESYFFSKTTEGEYEIVGKYFDNDMMDKVSDLMERARSGWPLNFREWGSDKSLDFKHKYYKGITTVGVLNGTIMTARDAGNAMWGGWTRHMYFCPILGCPELLPRLQAHLFMRALSEGYSWYKRGQWEDRSSAVMQSWGFENSSPF